MSASLRKPPIYATAGQLARRSQLHRTVVVRLIAQNLLLPDAFVVLGANRAPQPLFRLERSPTPRRMAGTASATATLNTP
jgi:hypothetical protein